MLIAKTDFLRKYNIEEAAFEATGLTWESLTEIFKDYLAFKEELEPSAIYLFNSLMKAANVHSVRYRIKDPEHLIEKIIRKKIESADSNITKDNYKEEVTDLIGLRALHLYKDDWEVINDYIRGLWNLKQKPVANYRKGDSQDLIDFFRQKDCDIKEHKYGYRSVHYLIETQPAKQKFYAEIQVRTIFEEAWAEIDHTIRYPYDLDNVIFFQFLLILNRLAGSADEMGSYIKFLKKELTEKESVFKKQIEEKTQIISDLEGKIDKLNLQGQELNEVKSDLEKLKRQKLSTSFFETKNLDFLKDLPSFQPSDSLLKLNETLAALQKIGQPITFPKFEIPTVPTFPTFPKIPTIPKDTLQKNIKRNKPKTDE